MRKPKKKLKDLTPLDFPITNKQWDQEIYIWKAEGQGVGWERWLKLRDIPLRSWRRHQNALSEAAKAPRTRFDAQ